MTPGASSRERRLVAGFHPVRELLRAGQPLQEIRLAREEGDRSEEIRRLAGEAGVPVHAADRPELDSITPDVPHQGVVAWAPPFPYADLDEVLDRLLAADRPEPALLVACDGITDPRNLGSIARTAEAVGAHALIIPRRRSAEVTTVGEKAAAGAFAHLPVVRCANIASALRKCSDRDVWIVGLDADGDPIYDCRLLTEHLVLLVGAEGRGLAHLSQVRSDQLIALPLRGHVESLNASVAAALALYEVRRRRDQA